jgi:phosphopantothenoylcysteine synthetase/decarboxylase
VAKKKKHFLITTGGTREYIDSVRFISNASSGKMGYALAQAALNTGCKVTLISASTLQPPVGVDFIGVETAADMFDAVKSNFENCDCLIMAAAVSDYTPVKTYKNKIKKSKKQLVLKLKPTKDVLKWAGKNKCEDQLIVGFALEDKNLRANAEKKLNSKKLDMIIANSPDVIGTDETTVHIKKVSGKWQKIGPAKKDTVSKKIIEYIQSNRF